MPDGIDPAPSENGETLSRLLHVAGPRQDAPASFVAEVKRVTRPAWRSKVRAVARARRRRRAWTLAAAAALLVSAGFLLWRLAPGLAPASSAPVRIATVEVAVGAVTFDGGAGAPGTGVEAGSKIETGPGGRLTLRLASGASARLDGGTVLRLESASALELRRGAVYLDTGPAAPVAALEVSTPYGVARDVGTQFEVRLLEAALRVQVREGEVEVDLGEASHVADAGTALEVGAGDVVTREDVPAHGPAWGWILGTSPPFELEGRTLGELLEWVARETGWRPRFADPDLEREVTTTVLHGSIAGVRPDQAPDLVLPSTGLRHRVEDGTLWIETAGAGPSD